MKKIIFLLLLISLTSTVFGVQVTKNHYESGAATATFTRVGEFRVATSTDNFETSILSTGSLKTGEVIADFLFGDGSNLNNVSGTDSTKIPDNVGVITSTHLANVYLTENANVIVDSHTAPSSVGANDLADDASFENATTRYYTFAPGDFVPLDDTQVWDIEPTGGWLKNGDTIAGTFIAGIHLPNGATVTELKGWFFRDDGASTVVLTLTVAANFNSPTTVMAQVSGTGTGGNQTDSDTTISSAVVDNIANKISLGLAINPNDNVDDSYFFMGYVKYTITAPLP